MKKPTNIINDYTQLNAEDFEQLKSGSWGSYNETTKEWSNKVYSGGVVREWIQKKLSIYGPYDSLAAACAAVPEGWREGTTVGIRTKDGIVEYQWKSGVEDSDLEQKSEDLFSTAELIAPETVNYVDSPELVTFQVDYKSRAGGRIYIKRNGIDIDSQNILPGVNSYTVGVPQQYATYTYSIQIKDILGQDVVMDIDSFQIRVGSIKIRTDLQNQLDSTVLGDSISTYLTVSNMGAPCHLYFIENGASTIIPGTFFNSYAYTIQLSQVVGKHSFKLKAVSIDASSGQEVEDEVDEQTFTYTRLTRTNTPFEITIDNVAEVTTAERVTIQFHYKEYDVVQKQVVFIIDGVPQQPTSTYFAAFAKCRYALNPQPEGTHTVQIRIDENVNEEIISVTSQITSFVVSEYTVDENIIPGYLFQFDPIQSENSGDFSLLYHGISEGTNGVDTDNNLVKFSGESYAELIRDNQHINPFTLSLQNGATIELIYNTKCIGNVNAPVMTTFQNSNDMSMGVEVSYKNISVGLGGNSRYTVNVSENTWIHATVVFSTIGFSDSVEDTIEAGYMYIYINGCIVFVQPLSQLPTANLNAYLTLNVDNALQNYGESNIRLLRFYNRPLSPKEVVQNYINSISDPIEKEEVSGRNRLELPVITFTEKSDTEYHFTDLLQQVDKKKQKIELVKCSVLYQQNSTDAGETWEYTTVATQGTSTLQFPIKNFKIKIYNTDAYESKGLPDKIDNAIVKQNGKNKKYISFKSEEGWDPENTYTLKCDYMESSHMNNTPTATFYNNVIDELISNNTDFPEWTYDTVSPARAGYIDTEGHYRTYSQDEETKRGYLDAIKGFPCVVKYIGQDQIEHYLGTYMFNIDKEANSLGFEVYNKHVEEEGGETTVTYEESKCVSIEGKSNTDEGAGSFCSFEYWKQNKSGYNSATQTYDENNGYYATEYQYVYLSDKNIIEHNLTFAQFIQKYVIDEPGTDFYTEAGNANARHLISPTNQDSYYNQDYETRYIYDEDYTTQPSNWHNWIDVVNFVSSSYETAITPGVTQSQLNNIRNQFEQYFDLNYCLLYYLQMITFAQVDNAGKNCMWDTWDGTKWYPRPYDLDTMAGLDNSGLEIIDPDVEYNEQGSPGNYVRSSASLTGAAIHSDAHEADMHTRRYSKFNTSGSRMWVLFKILYDTEIKNLYRRLRNTGVYDIDNIIDFYFAQTSDIIGETYYNKDSVAKFIQPIGTETQYLDQLHGNRRERFKYWITTRIKFCDSLLEYNRTEDNLINLRINPSTATDLVIKTYNPIYVYIIVGTKTGTNNEADAEYHFFCSPDSQYENGKEGVKITIPVTSGDKEVSIFGADSIKEIEGLSGLNCKLINLSRASKITTIELLNLRNLTSLVLGDNQYLQTLIAEGLTGIKNVLDLTNASNIKTVRIRQSTFDNLLLTTENTGTTVKDVDVSNSAVQRIEIKQAPFLRSLNVNGCQLLNTLILDNCNIEEIAFSDLGALKMMHLINCHRLKNVNISNLSYFELDGETFYNSEAIENIIMQVVHNVGQITRLSLESIRALQSLDISDTVGIYRIGFDTTKLDTLVKLDVNKSDITLLQLPQLSTLHYLNCNTCERLTNVTGLNADIAEYTTINPNTNLQETVTPPTKIFKNCKALTSIKGNRLKSTSCEEYFMGCYALEELDITNIDFSQASNFSGAFCRCYELPWTEIKKVLNSPAATNASYIFCYKYYDPEKPSLGQVPADIFNNVPNITSLARAFSFSAGSTYYTVGQEVPDGYLKINVINTPQITLTGVTNMSHFANNSSITSLPGLNKFPNVTDVSGAFRSTLITTVPSNVFANKTKITTTLATFADCTSITSSIGNILSGLTDLTTARGMFYLSTIKGSVPKGFLRTNRVLTNTSLMFYKTNITGVNPLFLDDDDQATGTYALNNISSMFGQSKLNGPLPENLFTGCTTIRNAGRSFGSSLADTSSVNAIGGVFAGTSITNVPQGIFDSLANATTTQGMFQGCATAVFPSEIDQINQTAKYTFLNAFTSVTNISQMFAGCSELILPISDDFIPTSVTQMNGTFAYSGIPNVVSLKNIKGLVNAIGAFANTGITEYPTDIFDTLSNLKDVSYFFEGCINLNVPISDSLFKDCSALQKTSYMFSHCENLGDGASTSTLPEGLFKNNLELENASHMFQYCYSMHGIIPKLFKNSVSYTVVDPDTNEEIEVTPEDTQYLKLADIGYMFYRSNFDTQDGHAFVEGFLDPLTRLENVESLFEGFNLTANGNVTGKQYSLYSADTLITSPYLKNASRMFSGSNLVGEIDVNLFKLSIHSLENIKETFLSKITSVAGGFLLDTQTNKNNKLQNVQGAFRSTTQLSSNIPECNNKNLFTNMKNTTTTFQGYAYNTTATNASSFSGMWVNGNTTVPTYATLNKRANPSAFSNSGACLGL